MLLKSVLYEKKHYAKNKYWIYKKNFFSLPIEAGGLGFYYCSVKTGGDKDVLFYSAQWIELFYKVKMMKLNPNDVLTKTFTRKVLGGYSSHEVVDFLQSVAGELEEKNQEQEELSDKLREKEASIREYREREEILRDTIASAQKMAVKIKQDAEKEANFILEDAKQKADLIVQDARDSLKTAYQDLSDLKRIHIQLKNTLKSILQSHQDLLDQDPIHSLLPSSFQSQTTSSMIEKKVNESLNKAAQSKESL